MCFHYFYFSTLKKCRIDKFKNEVKVLTLTMPCEGHVPVMKETPAQSRASQLSAC